MRPDLHSRPYEELGKEDFSAPASGTQLEVHFSIIPWQTERYFTRVMINVRTYTYAPNCAGNPESSGFGLNRNIPCGIVNQPAKYFRAI